MVMGISHVLTMGNGRRRKCLGLYLLLNGQLPIIEKTLRHELRKLLMIRLLMLVLSRKKIGLLMGVPGIRRRRLGL
ncbi:MAG: hypothetical protein CMB22_02435 [Euryarchaeota archaeon]|nr:hypothetical protein [Euryarchaeota archaeon]